MVFIIFLLVLIAFLLCVPPSDRAKTVQQVGGFVRWVVRWAAVATVFVFVVFVAAGLYVESRDATNRKERSEYNIKHPLRANTRAVVIGSEVLYRVCHARTPDYTPITILENGETIKLKTDPYRSADGITYVDVETTFGNGCTPIYDLKELE